ncbi:Hypothetical predicted protein [Pelobates cultripes]|uniref:Uncharacterized protein n=1 Tax=Pelobates cultripes TaxID=61616 RepID=A0AAD1SMV3_PELCU|nr:Hypothetical predicted protein [Pelobates cultripes]
MRSLARPSLPTLHTALHGQSLRHYYGSSLGHLHTTAASLGPLKSSYDPLHTTIMFTEFQDEGTYCLAKRRTFGAESTPKLKQRSRKHYASTSKYVNYSPVAIRYPDDFLYVEDPNRTPQNITDAVALCSSSGVSPTWLGNNRAFQRPYLFGILPDSASRLARLPDDKV